MPLAWLLMALANGVALYAMGFSGPMVFLLRGAAFCVEVFGIGFLYNDEIPVDGGRCGVEGFLGDTAKGPHLASERA
jgi:hypothetical protein